MVMVCVVPGMGWGEVGDAQLGTDHPWYPGELAMSSFERLFETQAAQYERATGRRPETAQDKALAAWLFRNTHYAHGEEGKEDLWGKGFRNDAEHTTREYWTGLFAHGIGLCGTTHAQWTAEMDQLLGPCGSRVTGTAGHNSFEVYLSGGPYGEGRWAMLDHDLSTVIFDGEGKSLLGLEAISRDWERLTRRDHEPGRQQGWLVCGLHRDDGRSYASYRSVEYLAGYAGPPPMVHLRQGERLRRYFEPGLEDGKTFVFWGRNYGTGGVPGPERSRTWVNQPEAMRGSEQGTAHVDGQWRYGNAVYEWRPDYREGVVEAGPGQVTLAFQTPYIIGATPPNDEPWGIYEEGGRNGLVLEGELPGGCAVAVSTDGGATWREAGEYRNGMDLTDFVKGHRQYRLRLGAGTAELARGSLKIRTVCQANPATFPRLKDGGTRVRYEAGGRALASHGPTVAQAGPRVVEGAFGTPRVTLELATPGGEAIRAVHVAAHVASSSPPSPEVRYQVEYSLDGGKKWEPLVKDGAILRRGAEPGDFWSQSMWSASRELEGNEAGTVRVRFRNDGGKRYLRAEGHVEYAAGRGAARVAYAWKDSEGEREESRVMRSGEVWEMATKEGVKTRWVEMAAE